MSIQLNLYILLAIFLCLFSSIVTQTPACSVTNQILCNGNFTKDNASRIQYECNANLSSSYSLPSCDNGDPSMTIFWFWYDDVCRYNSILNLPFATVSTTGISTCRNKSNINITYESCINNYMFNRTTMIIKNFTNTTPQKYICFLSNNQAVMNYSSTRIYSINISESITPSTTTPFSTTALFSTTTSTMNDTDVNTPTAAPRTSPPLEIILPSVFGGLLIILLVIGGIFFYRRRRRKLGKRSDKFKLEPVSSRTSRPSIVARQAVYGDDISTVESEHNYPVWRPVQKRN